MKIKYNTEIISGGFFSLISAITWFLVNSQIKTMEKGSINAQTMPRIAIGGLFIFSVALLIQGLLKEKKEICLSKTLFRQEHVKKELKSLIFIAILVVYALLFNALGFIVDSVLMVTAILLYYRSFRWWYYLIAYLTIAVVFVVFKVQLNVELPTLFF